MATNRRTRSAGTNAGLRQLETLTRVPERSLFELAAAGLAPDVGGRGRPPGRDTNRQTAFFPFFLHWLRRSKQTWRPEEPPHSEHGRHPSPQKTAFNHLLPRRNLNACPRSLSPDSTATANPQRPRCKATVSAAVFDWGCLRSTQTTANFELLYDVGRWVHLLAREPWDKIRLLDSINESTTFAGRSTRPPTDAVTNLVSERCRQLQMERLRMLNHPPTSGLGQPFPYNAFMEKRWESLEKSPKTRSPRALRNESRHAAQEHPMKPSKGCFVSTSRPP